MVNFFRPLDVALLRSLKWFSSVAFPDKCSEKKVVGLKKWIFSNKSSYIASSYDKKKSIHTHVKKLIFLRFLAKNRIFWRFLAKKRKKAILLRIDSAT